MGDLFNQLHNDKTPFDFDGWEQSAAEIKLLTMPPIRYETADDMANAVKPPSYWEKRAQTAKYQNNFNWADQECSSDSEISLIDSVVLSPRPLNDPTPPIKLRDVIESSCVNPSRSIIRKDAINKNNNEKISKNNNCPTLQKNAKIVVRKANSNNDLQPKKIASNVLRAKSVANVITDRPLFNVPKLPRLEKNAVSKTCPLTAIEFPDIGGRF
uniref:Uncharacterized protein n=1 Tax=Panagrolaimus superbus TaxID=310955 RepID=A0A914ZC54_9BILA